MNRAIRGDRFAWIGRLRTPIVGILVGAAFLTGGCKSTGSSPSSGAKSWRWPWSKEKRVPSDPFDSGAPSENPDPFMRPDALPPAPAK